MGDRCRWNIASMVIMEESQPYLNLGSDMPLLLKNSSTATNRKTPCSRTSRIWCPDLVTIAFMRMKLASLVYSLIVRTVMDSWEDVVNRFPLLWQLP